MAAEKSRSLAGAENELATSANPTIAIHHVKLSPLVTVMGLPNKPQNRKKPGSSNSLCDSWGSPYSSSSSLSYIPTGVDPFQPAMDRFCPDRLCLHHHCSPGSEFGATGLLDWPPTRGQGLAHLHKTHSSMANLLHLLHPHSGGPGNGLRTPSLSPQGSQGSVEGGQVVTRPGVNLARGNPKTRQTTHNFASLHHQETVMAPRCDGAHVEPASAVRGPPGLGGLAVCRSIVGHEFVSATRTRYYGRCEACRRGVHRQQYLYCRHCPAVCHARDDCLNGLTRKCPSLELSVEGWGEGKYPIVSLRLQSYLHLESVFLSAITSLQANRCFECQRVLNPSIGFTVRQPTNSAPGGPGSANVQKPAWQAWLGKGIVGRADSLRAGGLTDQSGGRGSDGNGIVGRRKLSLIKTDNRKNSTTSGKALTFNIDGYPAGDDRHGETGESEEKWLKRESVYDEDDDYDEEVDGDPREGDDSVGVAKDDIPTKPRPVRICHFTGRLYCYRCHWNDKWFIPGSIFVLNDLSMQPVGEVEYAN
ncbi:unnamed protein product [Protopolystoma xenopodis]|uniref:Uncharacterized protein n=1 Tax=Protopolystoma xenopodis TaxID=117903 RepID=A0A3S5BR56_9PLAT|nr:unnamed protein product [Protopolystoma xenopodis]